MRLIDLMKAKIYDDATFTPSLPKPQLELNITGITADSRDVRKGFLFAALRGQKQDGRQFISQAIQDGAIVILAEEGTTLPTDIDTSHVLLITDKNIRRRFAIMTANFYKAQPKTIVGVTGTNGKTSTVHFAQQLWQLLGNKSVSLGTLGVHGYRFKLPGKMTSPDPVRLHAALADVEAAGVTHLAMECSSHGLDQSRMDGVRMTAAAFTNLTRDHLDYHGSMDEYAKAKARLFSNVLMPGGTAVINADAPYADMMIDAAKARGQRVITFGDKGYDIKLKSQEPNALGQDIVLEVLGKDYEFHLPLIGLFQAYNVMCALGLVMAEFVDKRDKVEELVNLLPHLKGVSGRVELIEGHPKQAAVYVDYAHTPDALEQVLSAIRPHTQNRIITVFGCGGDRDKGKRPLMAEAATKLSDVVIVTDDNPRSENPDQIRADVMVKAPKALNIGDRKVAIAKAIELAQTGDVVIIAGKGHEQGQTIGDQTYPFDDRDEARKAILSL